MGLWWKQNYDYHLSLVPGLGIKFEATRKNTEQHTAIKCVVCGGGRILSVTQGLWDQIPFSHLRRYQTYVQPKRTHKIIKYFKIN